MVLICYDGTAWLMCVGMGVTVYEVYGCGYMDVVCLLYILCVVLWCDQCIW